jgi:MFS family permease
VAGLSPRDGEAVVVRTVLAVQTLRALLYGFGAVLLGDVLARQGVSDLVAGAIFTTMLVGMAASSLAVGRWSERVGIRRAYIALFAVLGISGTVFAVTTALPLLLVASLTGTMSTDPERIRADHLARAGDAQRCRRPAPRDGLRAVQRVRISRRRGRCTGCRWAGRAAARPPGAARWSALAARLPRGGGAAQTNAARYATRPLGPLVAGTLLQRASVAAPFIAAGALKCLYDVVLFVRFRRVALPESGAQAPITVAVKDAATLAGPH